MPTVSRLRRQALCLLATTTIGLAALTMTPQAWANPLEPTGDDATIAPADPLLDAPQRGEKAIRALGEQLLAAAALNDLRPAALRSLLRNDKTAWVDPQGMVFFVDPAPDSTQAAVPEAPRAAPLADTFVLHSNPEASLKILLDFDGASVTGTGWNSSGVTPGMHPAWDPAGNGPAFNDSELAMIQQVWAIVAEDYAPFGVDVTTQDPGDGGMVRSSSSDTTYGTRVLITPSDNPFATLCNRACGGVAYLSVFDRVGSYNQPAWVFPQALGNRAKAVAEAATHEAGHNLGLAHDGTSSSGYYSGHGAWAPIMGVGYDRPIVQWSAGSYPGAANQQDDTAILTGYLGARADEASGSITTPSALPTGTALIGTRNDVDAYLLGSCTLGSTVDVVPAGFAPNLDVKVSLYDSNGTQQASDAPVSGRGDGTTASGLGGSVTVPMSGEGWVLTVEGVGEGAWASGGYDDYGSLGRYSTSAPGCDGALTGGVPSQPNDAAASGAGNSELTLTWSAPTTEGTGPVTGYLVSRSGSPGSVSLPADARAHTFTGLTADTSYQLSVRAVNAAGAGAIVTITASTLAPTPSAPNVPQNVTGSYNEQTEKLEVWWAEPTDSGTQPIRGYAIHLDGAHLGELDPSSRSVTITRESGFAEGQYVVAIAAVNAVGSSPLVPVTITVTAQPTPVPDPTPMPDPTAGPDPTPILGPPATAPSRMRSPKVVVKGRKVVVKWAAAVADNSPITGYRIDITKGKDRNCSANAHKFVFKKLKPGKYKIRITAVNAVGTAPFSTWVKFKIR